MSPPTYSMELNASVGDTITEKHLEHVRKLVFDNAKLREHVLMCEEALAKFERKKESA